MPVILKADYKIVMPLFIGDVDHKVSGLLPASIKGMLRFYWRALQWGRCRKAAASDTKALEQLHNKEGVLFGSSAEQGTGQAKFNLRVSMKRTPPIKADWPKSLTNSGYLGMGLWESGSKEKGNYQAPRQYYEENYTFTVQAVIHPALSSEDQATLKDSMILFGLIGGLGSRSRRAFGSVAIQQMNDESFVFKTETAYQAAITTLLKRYAMAEKPPPYSAFSQDACIGIHPKAAASARSAHDHLGYLFKQHRGQPSSLRGSQKRVFGMPYSGGGTKENDARRASPLLMHIHPIGNQYQAVCTFLPAYFHHDRALESVDYQLIRDFLIPFNKVAWV